jgi:HSP20 family protein
MAGHALRSLLVAMMALALLASSAMAMSLPFRRHEDSAASCAKGRKVCDVTEEHHGGVQPAGDYNMIDLLPFVGHPWHLLLDELQRVSPSISRVARTAVDVHEQADAYLFRCDVPGLSSNEVHVVVHDGNVLTISGERKLEQQFDDESSKKAAGGHSPYSRIERQHGAFVRSFAMPATADLDHVKATVNRGVLTVTVPKKEVSSTDEASRVSIEWSEL